MKKVVLCLGIWSVLLMISGCTSIKKEETSVEVSFEIIDPDEIPNEMVKMINKKKEKGFRITYEDDEGIYVGHGYGKQDMEGYQIEIDKCLVSEHFIYVHTSLLGPEKEPKEHIPSCPYIVFRVNEVDKHVIFMN